MNILLAQGALGSGNYVAARTYLLQGLEYAERTAGRPLVSVSLGLGELALIDRDLPRARDHFAAALEMAHRLRDQIGIGVSLIYCAGLAAASAKPESAMRLQGAASKMRETLGLASIFNTSDRTIKPELDSVYRQLGQLEAETQLAAGRAMSTAQAVDYAFREVLSDPITAVHRT